jgi:hypothetical protein
MSWKEVAKKNWEYLRKHTIYLSKAEVRRYVTAEFGAMSFLEGSYIRHHHKSKVWRISSLTRVLPFIPWLVRTFHMDVVFFTKPPGD